MKTDFEIVEMYINEYDKELIEKLSYQEQILYKCQLRDTLAFRLYLTRYRILEFANNIVCAFRK